MAEFHVNATLFVIRESTDSRIDKPVKQHMAQLESRIQRLSQEVMHNHKTRRERNRIETELRVVQQALELYREAIQRNEDLERTKGKHRHEQEKPQINRPAAWRN